MKAYQNSIVFPQLPEAATKIRISKRRTAFHTSVRLPTHSCLITESRR